MELLLLIFLGLGGSVDLVDVFQEGGREDAA